MVIEMNSVFRSDIRYCPICGKRLSLGPNDAEYDEAMGKHPEEFLEYLRRHDKFYASVKHSLREPCSVIFIG